MEYLDLNCTSKEKISDLVQKFAITAFGLNFKFRPNQKETIVDIICQWKNGTKNVILNAPTGSGKSYIALIIGGVLSKYFGKKGYVLISDLSLLQQYYDDVDMYFPNWGVIRGQQTYICNVNGFNFTVGACKLAGYKTYSQIISNCPECSQYCEYILARRRAINADVTVCTYPFWLIQQNYVRRQFKNDNGEECAPFGKRDFVICDEAHKLLDIVQSQFSPRFGRDDQIKINLVVDNMSIVEKEETKHNIHEIREKIKHTNFENVDVIFNDLETYIGFIKPLAESTEYIKKQFAKSTKISKNDRILINACDFIDDHYKKFLEYVKIIEKSGTKSLIKNDSDLNKDVIIFNCLNESYLMNKVFHSNCEKALYMSATIGDPDIYANSISCNDSYSHFELPPIFDYAKSPIFFVNEYKMSYKEKETSFPRIAEMIHSILMMYKDKSGIIQTGSYAFAKKLFDILPNEDKKRILLYNDSHEKQEQLDDFKYNENKVLIGPSLTEGLSLDDDLCRFQIIMKMPYPSLNDRYISIKNKYNPRWYNDITAVSLLQGVGRGVRNENDWCITFILDACFNTLYMNTKSMFSKDFVDRIQVIPSQAILNNI